MTITGGEDTQLLPVLFATASPDAIPDIEATPGVESVRVDKRIDSHPPPSKADGPVQASTVMSSTSTTQVIPWGVQQIAARSAASRVAYNQQRNVTVAVIDSGIDYTHPDLEGSVVWGANFTRGSEQYGLETAVDGSGHGTAVAGVIAANNNTRGVVGVAPGAKLYAIKVLRSDNTGTISSLINGLDAAVRGPDGTIGTADDADIIQMSTGTTIDVPELESATSAAAEHAVLVSSAGNSGDGDIVTNEVTYPAKYQEPIAVAATNPSDETTLYSSEGDEIDVAAPGEHIQTLHPGSGVTTFSGTSAAAPHVTGSIALLLAVDSNDGSRDFSAQAIRERLQQTALDIETEGVDPYSGYGRIRADVALPANVQLSLTVNRTVVPPGQAVAFSVTNADTGNPVNATLTIGETVLETGSDGRAVRQFPERNQYTVTASQTDTVQAIYQSDSLAIQVGPPPSSSLSPATRNITAGQTAQYNITLSGVTHKIQSYEFAIHVENGTTATIAAVTPRGASTASTSISYSENNSSVAVTAHDTAGINDTIGTLTVKGVTPGTTNLILHNITITDTSGNTYEINESTTAVTVNAVPRLLNSTPRDLNSDGRYEDINGDGTFNIVDVNAFFQQYQRPPVQTNAPLFDYNSDGQINIVDVNRLFRASQSTTAASNASLPTQSVAVISTDVIPSNLKSKWPDGSCSCVSSSEVLGG